MLDNMLPFIYGTSVILLLFQAIRVMSRGLQTSDPVKEVNPQSSNDRTGQVTIHPEILNKDGDITDEDLLTVRFSQESDPPQSVDS
tara:strand:- start:311 stop:568 length:258 start_codon:yes stop_codon:yes gene_type:complete